MINTLLRRTVTGPNVIETSSGWDIKAPRRLQATSKMVRVTLVLEDRLRVQEVRLTDWQTTSDVGSTFDAAPWPGQGLSDYANADQIVMVAIKFGGFWVVQMTGDRPYVSAPATTCDNCV